MTVDPPEEHPEQSRRGFIKGLIVRRRQGKMVGGGSAGARILVTKMRLCWVLDGGTIVKREGGEGLEPRRPEVERGNRNESVGIGDIGRGARIVWLLLAVRAHPITHLMSGQRH